MNKENNRGYERDSKDTEIRVIKENLDREKEKNAELTDRLREEI